MRKAGGKRVGGRNERGGGALETALVALTLISMILFIMEMGRILLMQQFIGERARATARAAVVNGWTAPQAQNYLVYNNTSGNGAGYLGLLPSQVSYATLGTSGTADYRVQVKVSGVPVFTWIPYIARQYTLAPIVATMPAQSFGATN
jgi:Flp pilus assembly protein TadG